jgi:hypothetical protein
MNLEPDSPIRTDVLRFSPAFGRDIRQDPPAQLGVPTQHLALLALGRDEPDIAAGLVGYMLDEFEIIFDTVLNGWLVELLDHLTATLQVPGLETLLRVPGHHVWDANVAVARTFQREALEAVDARDVVKTALLLDHVRRVLKTVNDESVRFIQDILTFLDERSGEQAPIAALRGPYESIWRTRYATWDQLSAEERLQLSCEGMRTHFGGPERDGEFAVIDEGDRYRMDFASCGTGGMLRYGDPETGEGPWPTTGVNRTPQPYTWGKTGVPWYCVHCSLYLEHWPAEDYGYPLRPVLYDDSPSSPLSTSWFVYKATRHARSDDYARIGRTSNEASDGDSSNRTDA